MPGRTLVVALVLAWGGAAAAADADGNFVIKGAGTATCATLQKAKAARDERYASIAGWLDGYLSAQNELRGATFDLAPWQQTELLLAADVRYSIRLIARAAPAPDSEPGP
jgi:hypothetical protein